MIDLIGISMLSQLILVFAANFPFLDSLAELFSHHSSYYCLVLSPQHRYSRAMQLFLPSNYCFLYSHDSLVELFSVHSSYQYLQISTKYLANSDHSAHCRLLPVFATLPSYLAFSKIPIWYLKGNLMSDSCSLYVALGSSLSPS